jgi:hypothetical protein
LFLSRHDQALPLRRPGSSSPADFPAFPCVPPLPRQSYACRQYCNAEPFGRSHLLTSALGPVLMQVTLAISMDDWNGDGPALWLHLGLFVRSSTAHKVSLWLCCLFDCFDLSRAAPTDGRFSLRNGGIPTKHPIVFISAWPPRGESGRAMERSARNSVQKAQGDPL